jgi:hypothetical protein
MISVGETWIEDAACVNHPFLGPDSWSKVQWGYPHDEGTQAVLVCRFVCPVRQQCQDSFRGNEMIAGGGWFNRHGYYNKDHEQMMELHQAATYIGVPLTRLQNWVARKKLIAAKRYNGRVWLWLTEVQDLAKRYGPPHGTVQAWQLHLLRGEEPCATCVPVAQYAYIYA